MYIYVINKVISLKLNLFRCINKNELKCVALAPNFIEENQDRNNWQIYCLVWKYFITIEER